MVGAATYVASNDPSAAGSRFPACQFRAITSLWCPGCGLTRGFHKLFTGDIVAAMQLNVFAPLLLVVGVAAWWSWLRASFGRPPVPWPRWSRLAVSAVLPALLVVYGIVRNVPVAPFSSLAP